jgi:hypothetical protein
MIEPVAQVYRIGWLLETPFLLILLQLFLTRRNFSNYNLWR